MTREYTVAQRAETALKAMPRATLGDKQLRQIDELLYTLSESGHLPRLDKAHAVLLWGLVQLVKDGGFTDDMGL